MQILYCNNYPDGYNKICAIKPDDWVWGEGELNEKVFSIVKVKEEEVDKLLAQEVLDEKEFIGEKEEVKDIKAITEIKLRKQSNDNDLCWDSKAEKITLTPIEFKTVKSVSGLKEVARIAVMKEEVIEDIEVKP